MSLKELSVLANRSDGMVPAYLHFYWTSWQFSPAKYRVRLQVAQAKSCGKARKAQGGNMDEFASQWYQAGSLFIQAGFLIAAVWAVRAILKSVRASQEQMGALLRLTVGRAHSEQSTQAGVRATPFLLDGSPAAQHLGDSAPDNQDQPAHGRRIWAGLIGWLQQPMASAGFSPWRRAVRWLQAPAGS